MPDSNPVLDAALAFLRLGFPVLPLRPGTKIPLTPHGFKDASTDETQIRKWFGNFGSRNLAVATGAGLLVVDVDPRSGGEATLETLEATHGKLPDTPTVLTPGGGTHRYYRVPSEVRSRPHALGPGVDVKADGGYVVAPPSLFQKQRYEWELSSTLDTPMADCPAWILERLEGSFRAAPALTADPIAVGTRHATLMSLAGSMRRRGMSEAAIVAALSVENGRCVEPLPADEIATISRSAASYAPEVMIIPDAWDSTAPTLGPRIEADAAQHVAEMGDRSFEPTDTGNAYRLAHRYGGSIRYCPETESWRIWDGSRWRPDTAGFITELARRTVAEIRAEADRCGDVEAAKCLWKWSHQSQAQAKLEAMTRGAATLPDLVVAAADWDRDGWVLNTPTGTIDLRSGRVRPARSGDHLTKMTGASLPVTALAGALAGAGAGDGIDGGTGSASRWSRFIAETCLSREISAFLQRAAGYSLSGDTREEVLFFCWGPTATGKSTFLEAVMAALGDYAHRADFQTFLDRRGSSGGPRDDVADLAGARFVASIEVDEGQKLAEGLLKQLTGGDTVRARNLYRSAFTYRPQLKLWLAANQKPRVSADDSAIWRRILLIPFVNTVAATKIDPTLKIGFRDTPCSDALQWMVDGCLAWQRQGLGVPAEVRQITDEYRTEQNPLHDFLGDRCRTEPGAWVAAPLLWAAYRKWAEDQNLRRTLTRTAFGRALRAAGCWPDRRYNDGHTVRVWNGIRPADDWEDPDLPN